MLIQGYLGCESNPCENAGRCQIHEYSYICNCVAGTGGRHCEGKHLVLLYSLVYQDHFAFKNTVWFELHVFLYSLVYQEKIAR